MPRTIKADGRTITVPDDATPEEINQIVGPAPTSAKPLPTVGASHVGGPIEWLGDVENDLRGGGSRTFVGRGLGHMQGRGDRGYSGLESGTTPQVADFMGSVPLGVAKAIKGAAQLGTYHPKEADAGLNDLISGGSQALTIPTAGEAGSAVDAVSELPRVISGGASAIRSAAIGDPDAAALRGLRVPAGSPKTLRTVQSVQGARPYLQGAQSLEDLQAKIPAAKNEIWGPYKKAVDSLSDRQVTGPDGPTTVGALEAERQQLSALNRELKSKTPNPEAVQLAQQKGMNQAQLLNREKAVQRALDPELAKAGIDPQAIRKTFGQVADVGSKVSGKSTIAEAKQPYGFSKLKDVSVAKPLSNIPLAGDIVRDVAAGRYLSAKPTDVALREAFRPGVAKPDLGEFHSPYLLGSGEELGRPHFGPEPAKITPAPPTLQGLPAAASSGDAQPMLRYARPYVEPPEASTVRPMPPVNSPALPSSASPGDIQPYIAHRTVPAGPAGEVTRITPGELRPPQTPLPATLRIAHPPLPAGAEGPTIGLRPATKGLLGGAQEPVPVPEPTTANIYPAGSAYRGLQPETPFYPPASAFRPKAPVAGFDLDEYLRNHP